MKKNSNIVKKLVAFAIAFATVTGTGLGQVAPAVNSTHSSSAIVVSAATTSSKSNKKLSGVTKTYISCLVPGKLEVCCKVNTTNGVENMQKLLDGLATCTSGAKAASYVTKYGAAFVPDIGGKAILACVTKIFKSMSGVSNSAKKASSELKTLRKKYPNKGIRLYFGQKAWKIYTQD